MKSRNALAHISDASLASLASESSCLVSSKSDLMAFISLLSASISSIRGSWDRTSTVWGGGAIPNIPEKRLELGGGGRLLLDDAKSGRLMVWESGLPGVSILERLDKNAESETDEMRLCPFIREPVRGVNDIDARLLDNGVVNPARAVSRAGMLDGGARRLSA